jgi:hypothetical protein
LNRGGAVASIRGVEPLKVDFSGSYCCNSDLMRRLKGRERTVAEHAELLAVGGWRYEGLRQAPGALQSVFVGTAV